MIPDKLKGMSTLEIAQLADNQNVEVIDLLNGVDRKRVSIDQQSVIESYRNGGSMKTLSILHKVILNELNCMKIKNADKYTDVYLSVDNLIANNRNIGWFGVMSIEVAINELDSMGLVDSIEQPADHKRYRINNKGIESIDHEKPKQMAEDNSNGTE